MLFDNRSKIDLQLPEKDQNGKPINVAYLIQHLCEHVMRDPRKELFVLNGSMYDSNLSLTEDC